MYRFLVVLAVSALASARVSIFSMQIENDLESNLLDFSGGEGKLWPFFQKKNSSIPNGQLNEVSDVFTTARLTAVPSEGEVGKAIRYCFGKRVKDDRMVGYAGNTKTWDTPQDVTLDLKYPESGQGAKVTFVQIIIGQSSQVGDAKVTAGGIGQHSIEIAVTAKQTTWVNYVVYFYGI